MADVKGKEAPKEEGGGGFVFLIIVLLVALWFMQGSKRAAVTSAMIQSPIAPGAHKQWLPFWNGAPGPNIGQPGTVSGGISSVPEQASGAAPAPASVSVGKASAPMLSDAPHVSVLDFSGARASDPQQENIVLYADQTNTAPVAISGWQLRSKHFGRTVLIGGGVETALTGQPASPSVITLAPGTSAIISTGRSPVGISFRENKCTGYLAQFQLFNPPLAQRCPYPNTELVDRSDLSGDQQCTMVASGLTPCRAVTQPPSGVSGACGDFLQQRFTYNGCVSAHKADADFGGGQWRIYLGQNTELWNNSGDTIDLLDAQGKLVTSVTY